MVGHDIGKYPLWRPEMCTHVQRYHTASGLSRPKSYGTDSSPVLKAHQAACAHDYGALESVRGRK